MHLIVRVHFFTFLLCFFFKRRAAIDRKWKLKLVSTVLVEIKFNCKANRKEKKIDFEIKQEKTKKQKKSNSFFSLFHLANLVLLVLKSVLLSSSSSLLFGYSLDDQPSGVRLSIRFALINQIDFSRLIFIFSLSLSCLFGLPSSSILFWPSFTL